jgi:hypothetical protein
MINELKKIEKKHEQLSKILIEYKCVEALFGDSIIDDICEVFNYPTTIVYYKEED